MARLSVARGPARPVQGTKPILVDLPSAGVQAKVHHEPEEREGVAGWRIWCELPDGTATEPTWQEAPPTVAEVARLASKACGAADRAAEDAARRERVRQRKIDRLKAELAEAERAV